MSTVAEIVPSTAATTRRLGASASRRLENVAVEPVMDPVVVPSPSSRDTRACTNKGNRFAGSEKSGLSLCSH
jgi:hypothetical protein